VFAWYKIRLYTHNTSSLVQPGLSRHSIVIGDSILYDSLSIMQLHCEKKASQWVTLIGDSTSQIVTLTNAEILVQMAVSTKTHKAFV
jgi:hypothetical protein